MSEVKTINVCVCGMRVWGKKLNLQFGSGLVDLTLTYRTEQIFFMSTVVQLMLEPARY